MPCSGCSALHGVNPNQKKKEKKEKRKHFKPWHILKETTKLAGPFGTMPQEPWHSGKGGKPDHLIQHNCGEVRTHESYKTITIWENFNKRGTKMILLSDKLWLTVNDP